MASSTHSPDWKRRAREKRAAQIERIPQGWRLPPLAALPRNALLYIRGCTLLTLEELTITEILDARALLKRIATGHLSAVDVARAFCKRAALAQQLVGCCTELLFQEAIERAALLDQHLAATGQVVGPLHGLPISLKDNIDIRGHDSTWGNNKTNPNIILPASDRS